MKRSITDSLIRFGILKQKYYASYYADGKILYSVELGDLIATELEFIKGKKFMGEDGREYSIVLHAGFNTPRERFAHKIAIENVSKERIGKHNNSIISLFMLQKASMDIIEMRGQSRLRLAEIPRNAIAWISGIIGSVIGAMITLLLTWSFR